MTTEQGTHRPPYMTYPSLKTTIEEFAESTTPTKLNRHVLSKLSGAGYFELVSGFRYLGLIEKNSKVRGSLNRLVQARRQSENNYKEELLKLLQEVYEPIVEGVDIKKGTLPELEKCFKNVGVPQGQMLTRAVRFYVKALQDCGFEVSPHITKPRRRTQTKRNGSESKYPPKGRKAKSQKGKEGPLPPPREDKNGPPAGLDRLPILGKDNAYIQYPSALTNQDYAVIKAAVSYLEALVKKKEGE